jgi:hypothetical protein
VVKLGTLLAIYTTRTMFHRQSFASKHKSDSTSMAWGSYVVASTWYSSALSVTVYYVIERISDPDLQKTASRRFLDVIKHQYVIPQLDLQLINCNVFNLTERHEQIHCAAENISFRSGGLSLDLWPCLFITSRVFIDFLQERMSV